MGNLFGGRGISRAAKRIAGATDRLVDGSLLEIRKTRERLNETLEHVDQVLEKFEDTLTRVDKLVDTATNSLSMHTKTLGMVLMILAALLCRLIIINIQSTARRTQLSAEEIILYAFYFFCLLVAFFFAYDLLIDLKLTERQGGYRIIFILVSASMVEFILKIFAAIVEMFRFMVHELIVIPIDWWKTPYQRGKMYFRQAFSIAFILYAIFLFFYYGDVAYGYYLFVIAIIRNYEIDEGSWKAKFKIALILYVAFAVLALINHILFSVLISCIFRPLWRFQTNI